MDIKEVGEAHKKGGTGARKEVRGQHDFVATEPGASDEEQVPHVLLLWLITGPELGSQTAARALHHLLPDGGSGLQWLLPSGY